MPDGALLNFEKLTAEEWLRLSLCDAIVRGVQEILPEPSRMFLLSNHCLKRSVPRRGYCLGVANSPMGLPRPLT